MLRTASILFALSFAVAPAAAQSITLRDLAVTPGVPAAPNQGVALEAWFDHANAVYAEGEAVQLSVRAGFDGYLTAFSIGPTGDVTRIFPNAFQPYNAVRAGEIVSIPGAGARAIVSGPLGEERIRIVLTSGPGSICPPARLSSSGAFQTVIGGASALQRDLSVAAAGDGGAVLAMGDVSFHTAPAAISGNASPIVVIAGGGYQAPETSSAVIVPQGRYPLPHR